MTAKQLKETRLKRGLTQEQMSKALNDTKLSTYQHWEQGTNPVPTLMILALIGLKCKCDKHLGN